MVELEGQKRARYWTFSVVDPSGLNLLRMSSESKEEMERWIEVRPPPRAQWRHTVPNDSSLSAAYEVIFAGARGRWLHEALLEGHFSLEVASQKRRHSMGEAL